MQCNWRNVNNKINAYCYLKVKQLHTIFVIQTIGLTDNLLLILENVLITEKKLMQMVKDKIRPGQYISLKLW